VGLEPLAYRIGDHQRKAGRIDDGGDRFVDLAIGFVERDRGRYGLLNGRDGREACGAALKLVDQLSRQRTPPSPVA
jgi:hypothetical protein